MDRARRAGFTALIVVVMVAVAGWLAEAAGVAGRRRRLADVHARRLGGPDRRGVRVGRVRRDRQPGLRAGRPARARGRLRDVVGFDGHAEGDLDGVDDPRAGSPLPDRQRCRASSRSIADATYSGGFAATGGAIAIRVVGGAVDRCGRLG